MSGHTARYTVILILALGPLMASPCQGQQVKLNERAPDPHGSPRPARNARDVPLRTSLYFELKMAAQANNPELSPDSVSGA